MRFMSSGVKMCKDCSGHNNINVCRFQLFSFERENVTSFLCDVFVWDGAYCDRYCTNTAVVFRWESHSAFKALIDAHAISKGRRCRCRGRQSRYAWTISRRRKKGWSASEWDFVRRGRHIDPKSFRISRTWEGRRPVTRMTQRYRFCAVAGSWLPGMSIDWGLGVFPQAGNP